MAKILTVFGATGQQGGALIDYVLGHPKLSEDYTVRGVTRDKTKPAAKNLISRGVEIVQADLDEPESLKEAMKGAYAVFSVTNYWDTGKAGIEIAQGKAVADAAVQAGVYLLIWSTLRSITKMTNGKITSVHHFDSKAVVEDYIRTLPINSAFFIAGWYMQNFKNPYVPQSTLNEDGSVTIAWPWEPTTKIPQIDISDTGKFIAPLLKDPARYFGRTMVGATALYTAQEIVDTWSRVSGKKVLLPVQSQKPEGSGTNENVFTDNQLLMNRFEYLGPTGQSDLDWTLAQLDEKDKLVTWEEYLTREGPWFEAP